MKNIHCLIHTLVFAVALGAACSGAATPAGTGPNDPDDDRVVVLVVTDAGVPEADARVLADVAPGPSFHPSYLGRCAEANLPYDRLESFEMDDASERAFPLERLIRITGPATCESQQRVAGIIIADYECAEGGRVPDGIVSVWGFVRTNDDGERVMWPEGSCYVGADISPAGARRDVPLDDGQCWSEDDCSGENHMCSLTHIGREPLITWDTCVTDADCTEADTRCVPTSRGQRCTTPGKCEPCCKP